MRNRLLAFLLAGSALAAVSGTAAAHDNVSFGLAIGVPAPAVTYVAPAPVYYGPPSGVAYYGPAPVYYGSPVSFVYGRPYYGWDHRWHDGWRHR